MNRKMPESVKRDLAQRRSKKGGSGGYKYRITCPIKFEPKPCFSNASIVAPVKNKPHICRSEGWWRVSAMPKPYHKHALNYGKAHDFACNANNAGRIQLIERMTEDAP